MIQNYKQTDLSFYVSVYSSTHRHLYLSIYIYIMCVFTYVCTLSSGFYTSSEMKPGFLILNMCLCICVWVYVRARVRVV